MAGAIAMTADGRGSRRRSWPPSGASSAARAAASLALSRARPACAIGERSLFRFARLALPGLPDPAARRRCAAWPGRSSAAPASRPRPIRRRSGSAIPTCSATRSWCCRAIGAFALPPEADIARLRRHITYGGFLLIDSAEGRAGGGFDESVRRLLAQTLPGELPIRIPDSHVLWKSFYVLRGAPGRIIAAPLPRRGRARSPPGGRLHAERSRRRAGARRLRPLGARGGPGRRRPARGGVPARRQPGDVRALPRLQDRAGAHRLHPAHAAAAAVSVAVPPARRLQRLAPRAGRDARTSAGSASRCCSSARRWPSRCRRCRWPRSGAAAAWLLLLLARGRRARLPGHGAAADDRAAAGHARAQPRGGAGRRLALDGGAAARRRTVARRAGGGAARARGAAAGGVAAGRPRGRPLQLRRGRLARRRPRRCASRPRGDATRIGEALGDVRARYAGPRSGRGGRRSPTASTPAASARARSTRATRTAIEALGAPVHTVGLGEKSLRDLSVAAVLADEFAFVRTPVTHRGGHPPDRACPTGRSRSRWNATGARSPPAASCCAAIARRRRSRSTGCPITRATSCSTSPRRCSAGEALTSNNEQSFTLKVIRDRVRVLHLSRPAVVGRALPARDAAPRSQRRPGVVLHPAHRDRRAAVEPQRPVADPVPDLRDLRGAAALVRPGDLPELQLRALRRRAVPARRARLRRGRRRAGDDRRRPVVHQRRLRRDARCATCCPSSCRRTPPRDDRRRRRRSDDRHVPAAADAGGTHPSGDVAAARPARERAALGASCRRWRASTACRARAPARPRCSRTRR